MCGHEVYCTKVYCVNVWAWSVLCYLQALCWNDGGILVEAKRVPANRQAVIAVGRVRVSLRIAPLVHQRGVHITGVCATHPEHVA